MSYATQKELPDQPHRSHNFENFERISPMWMYRNGATAWNMERLIKDNHIGYGGSFDVTGLLPEESKEYDVYVYSYGFAGCIVADSKEEALEEARKAFGEPTYNLLLVEAEKD